MSFRKVQECTLHNPGGLSRFHWSSNIKFLRAFEVWCDILYLWYTCSAAALPKITSEDLWIRCRISPRFVRLLRNLFFCHFHSSNIPYFRTPVIQRIWINSKWWIWKSRDKMLPTAPSPKRHSATPNIFLVEPCFITFRIMSHPYIKGWQFRELQPQAPDLLYWF